MHDPALLGLAASSATLGILAVWKARAVRWLAIALFGVSATWLVISESSPLNSPDHRRNEITVAPVPLRPGG
ncbi:hypothetical protein WKW77_16845 [Variovorax ureilyticus]|uniref:Uncharacterized protein n=1 Tax=Variovorax ureilyticus TaxID=1836198 RepID=A0ABU8VGI0_9BURK